MAEVSMLDLLPYYTAQPTLGPTLPSAYYQSLHGLTDGSVAVVAAEPGVGRIKGRGTISGRDDGRRDLGRREDESHRLQRSHQHS